MVPFLVALVLTLVVFIPTCSFTSKLFFRLSDQSKDNFDQFAVKMETILMEKSADVQSALLILDEETAIVGYDGSSDVQTCTQQKKEPVGGVYVFEERCITWKEPVTPECVDKSCLCLFRNFDLKEEGGQRKVNPSLVLCKELPPTKFEISKYMTKIESQSGKLYGDNEFIMRGGFVMGRLKSTEISSLINPNYSPTERRNVVYITSKGVIVTVCFDPECKETNIIFEKVEEPVIKAGGGKQ